MWMKKWKCPKYWKLLSGPIFGLYFQQVFIFMRFQFFSFFDILTKDMNCKKMPEAKSENFWLWQKIEAKKTFLFAALRVLFTELTQGYCF